MGKKAKLFNKNNSISFRLVNRSKQDPLINYDDAPKTVLVENNLFKDKKSEKSKYGIYYDEDYDYLQHLKDVEEVEEDYYFEEFDPKGARVKDIKTKEELKNVKNIIKLPSSLFDSQYQESSGMKNKGYVPTEPKPDWDPEIVGALFDDVDLKDKNNILDDDFVINAMKDIAENEETNFDNDSEDEKENDNLNKVLKEFDQNKDKSEFQNDLPKEAILKIAERQLIDELNEVEDLEEVELRLATGKNDYDNRWDCESVYNTLAEIILSKNFSIDSSFMIKSNNLKISISQNNSDELFKLLTTKLNDDFDLEKIFKKLSVGLVENSFIQKDNMLLFLYGCMKDTIPQLKLNQEKNLKNNQFKRMDSLLIEPVKKIKTMLYLKTKMVLSNSWRMIYEKLNRVISGRKTSKKRNSSCMQKLFNSFSVPLSALYVKTYFDAKSKKVVEQMISNIKAEFLQILSTLDWMDEVTRLRAIEKAKQIHTYVGYSNEILNDDKVMQLYEGLRINENWSYFTNMQKLKKHWTDNDFKKLKTKNIKTDWKKFSEAATINAFYNSLENSVKLPSGHEIIHGFDDKGRQFDKNGNHNNWWKSDTDEKFKNMTKCLIDQYDNYSVPEINMTVNGVLTLGENIADNGGLKQAYLVWCSSFRPEAMKARIFTGVHSPPKFRVIDRNRFICTSSFINNSK
ncbi:hypothetical protein RND71_044007 [Anisodus tanguticus]|uniref:Protein LTV1 homolog n=1 Tax=Anisodus tanguticus TaxID=243964 RepID=A0AAE1URF7_9SOLA|nr:hypothetical protein RND71_044007 [Anisodus tanguticus]